MESKLAASGVPFETWGSGTSKTLNHLIIELLAGESELPLTNEGLVRKEDGVGINVFFQAEDKLLLLVETKQVFTDGRERVRDHLSSIGEKMKPGESVIDAARRALEEELGIKHPEQLIGDELVYSSEKRAPVVSEFYPGLFTQRTIYEFNIYLSVEHFNAAGYQEIQSDKTSYFEWQTYSV